MTNIQDFRYIRRDGKAIAEPLTLARLQALGWQPDKIVEIQWSYSGLIASVRAPFGMLAEVAPGRQFVAVLKDSRELSESDRFYIYNGDGSVRMSLPDVQHINGKNEPGSYRRFGPSRNRLENTIGVVFFVKRNSLRFQLDIDLATGRVLDIYEVR